MVCDKLDKKRIFTKMLSQTMPVICFSSLLSAVAPDFSHNQLKSQTLVKVGGDILIECKPKMSPWGVILWRKGSEPLQGSSR